MLPFFGAETRCQLMSVVLDEIKSGTRPVGVSPGAEQQKNIRNYRKENIQTKNLLSQLEKAMFCLLFWLRLNKYKAQWNCTEDTTF